MGEILIAGSEGEWAGYQNTLSGSFADTKRRGSVRLTSGQRVWRAFTGTRDMWFHVRVSDGGGYTNVPGADFFNIQDSALNTIASLRGKAYSAGAPVYFNRRTELGAFERGVGVVEAGAQMHNWDIHIVITTTNIADDTITYTLYTNESRVVTETFVKDSAYELPYRIYLTTMKDAPYAADSYFQDVLVTDSIPTVGLELCTLSQDAVGAHTTFTNDYTAIDEAGHNTADAIIATAVGNKESWTFAPTSFSLTDKVIYAVVTSTVGQTDATVDDFKTITRAGGIDYLATAMGFNAVSPETHIDVLVNNPATALPWTATEITNLEIGVEAV